MTERRPTSLSRRLTKALSLWMGTLWLVTALGTAWYARKEVREVFDSALVESARRLLDLISHELSEHGPGMVTGTPVPDIEHIQDTGVDKSYLMYQVADPHGTLLMRSADAPEQLVTTTRQSGFSTTPDWRVYTLVHPREPVIIHVADPVWHRQEAQFEVMLWLLLPLLALLPVMIWLIGHIARRELAHVGRLAAQIQERNDRNLTPLSDQNLPQELLVISDGTNHLLQRLSHALDTERALAANAAHELRTPLATACLRLQAAQDLHPDDAVARELAHALASLHQLSRRTEKLLQMSRAESGAALARTPINLAQVAAAVAQEFWRDPALLQRLELQVPDDDDAWALGDFDAVAIVLRNLIENAVHHAPQGPIVLAVELPAQLRVTDTGPGIAPQRIADLQRRHRRGASASTPGYGLGLSIVTTIVERLDGTLELQSPPDGQTSGLQARVRLPAAPLSPGCQPP